MGKRIRIGALISGGGSNLQAIIDACQNGNISGQLICVGSDNPKAAGLKRASKYNIPSFVVDYPAIIRKFKEDPSKISLPGDFDLDELISKQSLVRGSSDANSVKYFLTTRAIAEAKLLEEMESYPFDLLVLVFFGIFGYTVKKLNFDVTPMVMGYILGPVLEYSFGQTVNLARGDTLQYIFVARPITAGILAITPFVTAGLWWRGVRLRRQHVKKTAV